MKLKKWKRIAGILAIILLGACVIVIAVWMQGTLSPTEIALKALDSDDQVLVSREASFIVFEPKDQKPSIGFIFYPGARVDYRSYAPIMHKIAEHGYFSALLSMPLNIAFLDPNLSDQVIENYPEIDKWVIGGHSLGGVVAANYVDNHPMIDGLVFLAAYPANDNLKDKNVKVLSIYGSLDGLTTLQDIAESKTLLPPDTVFVEVKGGNHSGFGSYGFQEGDNIATISAEQQWSQSVNAIIALFKNINE